MITFSAIFGEKIGVFYLKKQYYDANFPKK
jgi:hypothetical protein